MDFKSLNFLIFLFTSFPCIFVLIWQWIWSPIAQFLLMGVLSFDAAAVSSASGGGLFWPILAVVAGLDIMTTLGYSAFMVTSRLVANAASHLIVGLATLIDYDIALLSESSMPLGVSGGIVLNMVVPEWLITAVFVASIGFNTFRTCKSGV